LVYKIVKLYLIMISYFESLPYKTFLIGGFLIYDFNFKAYGVFFILMSGF